MKNEVKILRLPVNTNWYKMIQSGELTFDYREIKPYWIKRLEDKEYDIVEFYHRFDKSLEPMKFKFKNIHKGIFTDYNLKVYIINFEERI